MIEQGDTHILKAVLDMHFSALLWEVKVNESIFFHLIQFTNDDL